MSAFLRFYRGYTLKDLMDEYAITYYRLLDEAMISLEQERYIKMDLLRFSRKNAKQMQADMVKVRSEINLKTNSAPEPVNDIMVKNDRSKLKSVLKQVPKRP